VIGIGGYVGVESFRKNIILLFHVGETIILDFLALDIKDG
jgi:hypothetical protein